VFLHDGAIVPIPSEPPQPATTTRRLAPSRFARMNPINAHALTAMFKQIAANNPAGGWRKLKRDSAGGSWIRDPTSPR
jgi:hypothetical protein